MESVKIDTAKLRLAGICTRVSILHIPIFLTSRGKPVAVLVSLEMFQRLRDQEQEIADLRAKIEGMSAVAA